LYFFAAAIAFLVVIPEGDLLLLLPLPLLSGCHPRRGSAVAFAVSLCLCCHPVTDLLLSFASAVASSSHTNKNIIWTKAAHSLNVSSAAEKSASPPKPRTNHNRLVISLFIPQRC
jgi:hypothetical protein